MESFCKCRSHLSELQLTEFSAVSDQCLLWNLTDYNFVKYADLLMASNVIYCHKTLKAYIVQ